MDDNQDLTADILKKEILDVKKQIKQAEEILGDSQMAEVPIKYKDQTLIKREKSDKKETDQAGSDNK